MENWVKVVLSFVVMAVAMAATAYAEIGRPWDLGSLADWIAGAATFLAVGVALKTARDQGALALRVSHEERADRSRAHLAAEVSTAKSMIFVGEYGRDSLGRLSDLMMQNASVHGSNQAISPLEICRITARKLAAFTTDHSSSNAMLQRLVEVESCWGVAVICADLRIKLHDADAERSWNVSMGQLDAACNRLSVCAVELGARPEGSDSIYVHRRLEQALASR